jgi:hypothetical protein
VTRFMVVAFNYSIDPEGDFILYDDYLKAIATARADALREAAEKIITAGFLTNEWDNSQFRLFRMIMSDKQEGKNG